jgi:hypothetical protein
MALLIEVEIAAVAVVDVAVVAALASSTGAAAVAEVNGECRVDPPNSSHPTNITLF